MKKNGIFMLTALFLAIISVFSSCAVRNGAAAGYDKYDPVTWTAPRSGNGVSEKDAGSIDKGMTFTDVIDRIGLPQQDVGSGGVLYEWEMANGKHLVIGFEIVKHELYTNKDGVGIFGFTPDGLSVISTRIDE